MPKKQENPVKEAREESSKSPMFTNIETAEVEMTTYEFGSEVESTRSDGELVQEIVIGNSGSKENATVVLARKSEAGPLLRVVGSDELASSVRTDHQLELYSDAVISAAESAVKAAGLKGNEAKEALALLAEEAPKVIAKAMGEKNPEKALSDFVLEEARAVASGKSEKSVLSLEALTEQLAHARQKADTAKNDREYKAALVEIHAVEKAVYETRVALNPDASKKEKIEIANQVDGAVELIPDPLYEDGYKAVKNRIVELEKIMKDADKNKDGVAWTVARNEYDRHRAILPVLEKVEMVLDVKAQIDAMIAEKIWEQNEYSSKKREKGTMQKKFWKGVIERQEKLQRTIEDGIMVLTQKQNEDTGKDIEKLEAKRLESLEFLQTAQKNIQKVEKEMEELENMGVLIDFDTEEKPNEARSALYFQLMDTYKENPKEVMNYIDGMIKSKKVNTSTLGILKAVKEVIRVMESQPKVEQKKEAEEAKKVGEAGEVKEIPKTKQEAKVIPIEPRLRKTRKETLKPGTVIESVFETKQAEKTGLKPGDIVESVMEPEEVEEVREAEVVGKENSQERNTDEIKIIDYSNEKVQDLINAGIVENAGELELYERLYIELYIALDSLGLKPQDEGLPSSFEEMVNTKDSRGIFGKMFGAKTERVKLFNKLKEAHYTYIDSGKVDIGSVLKRQHRRYEDYESSMRSAGKF
ncbi:hypothetical protein HYV69_03730 [Candidatus Uhrbacteria bacterium]|nr:hypothetical protein [Candidatus Uhrbacteria bacterium]